MLDYYNNAAQIRWSILKKLDVLPGVKIYDVNIRPKKDHIRVEIRATLFDGLRVKSCFELPPSFELRHLHNQIDEIAEQYKAVFVDFFGRGHHLVGAPDKVMAGTGLRGGWPS